MSAEDLLGLELDWEQKHFQDHGIPENFLNEVVVFGGMKRMIERQVKRIRNVLPESCDSSAKFNQQRSLIKTLLLWSTHDESKKTNDEMLSLVESVKELQEKKRNSPLHGLKMLSAEEKTFWQNHNRRLNRLFRSLHDHLFHKEFRPLPVAPEPANEDASTPTASQPAEEDDDDGDQSQEEDQQSSEESEGEVEEAAADEEEEPAYWDGEEEEEVISNNKRKFTTVHCGTVTSNYFSALYSDACRVEFVSEDEVPQSAKVIKLRKTTPTLLRVHGLNDEGTDNGKIIYLDLR